MTNARQKGRTGEKQLAKILSDYSGLEFTLVPGSGSGTIKGDIICPKCAYCIEVKFYKESHLTDKMLTNKSNNIILWWNKLLGQAKQMRQKPLLVVKYNRSKWFVVTQDKPKSDNYWYISRLKAYVVELTDWLASDKPRFSA